MEPTLCASRPREGHGDPPRAPARLRWAGAAAASLRDMEMHQGRRPVYGGAPRNRSRKGYGDAQRAPARQGWAGAAADGVKGMEMHAVRRPVYGGAARML